MAYKRRQHEVSEILPDAEAMETGAQDFAYQADRGQGGGFLRFLVLIIVIVAVLGGGWYLLDRYTNLNWPGMNQSASVNPSGWQAVFLVNGQVYFGKIEKLNSRELVLKSIYYLQVVDRPLQQSQGSEAPTETQQELTLAKLGNEIHGPVDRMIINRDHVMIIEELKEDSKVVTAITTYLNEQTGSR